MPRPHYPRRNDKVNDSSRIPHANGFIIRILYGDDGPEEVMVKYDNAITFYDWEQFEFSWTDRYGGCWIIDKEMLS